MAKVSRPSAHKEQKKPEKAKDTSSRAQSEERRGKVVVVTIMTGLLLFFLFLGLLAPDTTREDFRPDGGTILWRLLFLLIPLGFMYFLLWGEKVLKWVERKKRRKRP